MLRRVSSWILTDVSEILTALMMKADYIDVFTDVRTSNLISEQNN
jgi:hypothetical protein